MKKFRLVPALAGFVLVASSSSSHAQFASGVLAYDTGSGFAAGFTNSAAALGTPASGGSITPFAPPFSKSQILSIGAGGEVTLQLDQPIRQDAGHPFGVDFLVFA